jgi:hypothetical protein
MGGPAKAVPRASAKSAIDLPSPRVQAIDFAAASGIRHSDVHGGTNANKYILEMTGHGVAVIDFDNDGWRDLFFVNGTRLDARAPAPAQTLSQRRRKRLRGRDGEIRPG